MALVISANFARFPEATVSALSTTFDELEESLQSGGVAACLSRLAEQLQEHGKFQELFEARKMQVRHELGLPLLSNDLPASLDADERRKLEDELIDRFREVYRDVGLLMFRNQELSRGWMLLHAAGEETLAARTRGDGSRQRFDGSIRRGRFESRRCAGPRLPCGARALRHVQRHHHLRSGDARAAARRSPNGGRDARASHSPRSRRQREGRHFAPGGKRTGKPVAAQLVESRDWLFGHGSYHIDTTHLASTVRFARVLDDAEALRLAIDLTEYGRRLDQQFQYAGDEPFADIYPSHALLFHAMLREEVDEALAYFRDKAHTVDIRAEGAGAAETYIALLDRLGRSDEAAHETVELIPPGIYTRGLAPTLFELCEKTGDFAPLVSACREREDLLGFAAGLIQAKLRA